VLKKDKKPELIAFGQSLYEMRKRNKLSQMELADILDVDRRQISRYETGEAEMGAMLYAKMQTALAVKIDDQLDAFLQQWGTLSDENRTQLLRLAVIMNKADGNQ
jgi:transcriptional regulator with XRE-family HTH domain